MLRYCLKLKSSREKLKRLRSAVLTGDPDFCVLFSSGSVEMHFFSFCAGISVAFLPFLTYFCFSFVVLLHSPAVLSTCISVVTGVKTNTGTEPNDKLIRIEIVIFFHSCTEKYLTGYGHV